MNEEPVRIGVFICHCGTNIGGFVDVPAVVEYAKTLPGFLMLFLQQTIYILARKTVWHRSETRSKNTDSTAWSSPPAHRGRMRLFSKVYVRKRA